VFTLRCDDPGNRVGNKLRRAPSDAVIPLGRAVAIKSRLFVDKCASLNEAFYEQHKTVVAVLAARPVVKKVVHKTAGTNDQL